MVPLSSTMFEVRAAAAKVTFVADEKGKISKMLVYMNGTESTARRLLDFDPSSVNLTEFTGEYFSEELNTTYSMVVESGKLVARHFRTGDVILSPQKEDAFSGDKWYFGLVEFTRDGNKTVTGCKVGSSRVKGLRFKKMTGVKI
jgi:hypothetical protein